MFELKYRWFKFKRKLYNFINKLLPFELNKKLRCQERIYKRVRKGKPISKRLLHAAWGEILQKKDLVDGKYYAGRCRNAECAQWSAKENCFWYMRLKFSEIFPESIRHPEDDDGFDLFRPIKEVIPNERWVVKRSEE